MDTNQFSDDFICKLYEATTHYYRFEVLSAELVSSSPENYPGLDSEAILAQHERQALSARETLLALWANRSEVLRERGFEKVE